MKTSTFVPPEQVEALVDRALELGFPSKGWYELNTRVRVLRMGDVTLSVCLGTFPRTRWTLRVMDGVLLDLRKEIIISETPDGHSGYGMNADD